MPDITAAGAYPLGARSVNRMGYGAMQLARTRAGGDRLVVEPHDQRAGCASARCGRRQLGRTKWQV
jgi:hypothetical protein